MGEGWQVPTKVIDTYVASKRFAPTGVVPVNWVYDSAIKQTYPTFPVNYDRNLRVFFTVSNITGATGYYRGAIVAGVLRELWKVMDSWTGFEVPDDMYAWADIINMSQILVIEREFDTRLLTAIFRYKTTNGPVVFDIDDHVLGFDNKKSQYEKNVSKFWSENGKYLEAVCRQVSCIIATTPKMAKWYGSRYGVDSYCIPNSIDSISPRWNIPFKKRDARGGDIIIGFMGGVTHGPDLDIIQEPVMEILDKYPHVKFKIVGYQPEWIFDAVEKFGRKRIIMDVSYKPLDIYPSTMYDIDVGLIPLARNDFNEIGKSDLKYLEYTMSGMACIASRVGQYRETIRNNNNGLLASDDEWFARMSSLIEHPELIDKLTRNAVNDVIKNRSILRVAKDWYKVLVTTRKKWGGS
jgi:glycosyltransferase involved in cell wall biosynthesis